jgi:hypothetical protein
LISGMGNTALYTSFLVVGPVWDRWGVRVTMVKFSERFFFLLSLYIFIEK